jgi:uncharacterized repeat protein (TIGR03837 family)
VDTPGILDAWGNDPARAAGVPGRRWDVFCRVVDNLGDVGVCWRLACGLARRGQHVRLWIDEPGPLAWMAPGGEPGVQCVRWTTPWSPPQGLFEPGDVVVEAFGCELPGEVLAAMAQRSRTAAGAPLWLDLEYLSAEPWVRRSHGLPSPQFHGPAAGLTRWFFFPGFEPGTGGLLREPGLLRTREAFDRDAWLAARGLARGAHERVLVVFCYDDAPALARLPHAWHEATGDGRHLVLLTPGPAQRAGAGLDWPAGTRVHALPWRAQDDFDRLLWSADLATVRGEDSLVRAIWAGVPFLWQAYPQHDGAHAAKVEAMLDALAATDGLAAPVAAAWRAWNATAQAFGSGAAQRPGVPESEWLLPPLQPWGAAVRAWRSRLAAQPDLVSQLLAFASAHGPAPG